MVLHQSLPPAAINPQAFPVHQNLQGAVPQNHLQEDLSLEAFLNHHQAAEAVLPAAKATAAPSEALYLFRFLGAHTEAMVTHLMVVTAALAL